MDALRTNLQRFVFALWAHRLLAMPAAVVAVALTSFYVHLLHESVARGEAFRQEQLLGFRGGHAGAAHTQRSKHEDERTLDLRAREIASRR